MTDPVVLLSLLAVACAALITGAVTVGSMFSRRSHRAKAAKDQREASRIHERRHTVRYIYAPAHHQGVSSRQEDARAAEGTRELSHVGAPDASASGD